MNPIHACEGRRLLPSAASLRKRLQGCFQIRWNLWLRFLLYRGDFYRNRILRFHAGSRLQVFIDSEPMAQLAIRLEPGLKGVPVDQAFYRGPSSPGKLLTRFFGQENEGP